MNKRYFWIKLKEDFFDSEQMDFIHEQPNGAEYIYIYLRLCLMAANSEGVVERRIGPMVMPYSIAKLAEVVRSTPDSVMVALNMFKQIGLVEETDMGAVSIPGIKDMVGSESESARRVRRFRAKAAAEQGLLVASQCDKEVTGTALHCNKNVTQNVTTDNRDKILDIRDKNIGGDTQKKAKKPRFSVMDAINSLPVGEPLKEALLEWATMRKEEIKKPVSRKALELGLSKLRKICGTDEALMVEVVNQSTFQDWAGFFPLKEGKAQPANSQGRREQMKEAVEKGGW